MPTNKRLRRAVIIGGGLAGMVIAKELGKRGMPVVILEAGGRLGGKAGADLVGGAYEEHGYHVFPGWYVNVRQLLRELGTISNLVDLDRFHHLRLGDFPRLHTYYSLDSLGSLYRDVFQGILPWHEILLSFYSGIDLAAESFDRRGFLDRVSANGFLFSRFYATDRIASFHQQTVLQASAVPSYEISAMTTQKLVQLWIGTPTPFLSILNGNLQEKLIAPFAARLAELGTEVRFGRRVAKLEVAGGRVCGVRFDDGGTLENTGSQDVFVLATPIEATLPLVDADVCSAENEMAAAAAELPRLADLVQLRSAPMAALNLYLKRKIPDLPAEHVNLYESRFGTSFIDVSQHWQGLPNTVLCMISSHFARLSMLPEAEMAARVIAELRCYVPAIRPQDIERWHLQSNLRLPLFLNTVGAWPFRPEGRTYVPNLFVAGDYCRSQADLTTMESAVMAALTTARRILMDAELDADVGLIPLKIRRRPLHLALKYGLLPLIAPFGIRAWLRRRLQALGEPQ